MGTVKIIEQKFGIRHCEARQRRGNPVYKAAESKAFCTYLLDCFVTSLRFVPRNDAPEIRDNLHTGLIS